MTARGTGSMARSSYGLLTVLVGSVLSSGICARPTWGAEPERPITFERDIWPMLVANCAACHGGEAPKGGLDLRTVSGMFRGGESGPALELSDPESSLLLERAAKGEMPPGK